MAFNNKKGNAITEPYTFLIVIVLLGLLTTIFFVFATQLSTNENSNLDDESVLYIAENNGFEVEGKNFTQEILTQAEIESSFYATDSNTTSTSKDDALEFLYYREKSVKWRSLVNTAYNAPAYFIGVFNLDLFEWSIVNNALSLLIWGIIFFVIYKIIRGLIK